MSFIDDLLGNFTGSKSRDDLANAKGKADADLKTGYDTGEADLTHGADRLDPYSTGGTAANTRYLDSLGVNGAAAQGAVENAYTSDPIQNALMDRIQKANTRAYTARGMNNSGAATQSLTNSLLDNWRQYQSQLAGAGAQGFQATGAQSNIDTQKGNMAYGYGATRAANEINYGNAIADSRNTGINNLFKVGKLVADGATAAAKVAAVAAA